MNLVFCCQCWSLLIQHTARGQLKMGTLLLLNMRAGLLCVLPLCFKYICHSDFESCCILTCTDFSLEDGTVFDSSTSRGAPFGRNIKKHLQKDVTLWCNKWIGLGMGWITEWVLNCRLQVCLPHRPICSWPGSNHPRLHRGTHWKVCSTVLSFKVLSNALRS